MKSIAKILVPVAFAFGAIGAASAQTLLIETEYPGPAPQTASMPSHGELAVIQLNEGAAVDNPAFEKQQATRSRAEVQSEARIAVPYGPAMNA